MSPSTVVAATDHADPGPAEQGLASPAHAAWPLASPEVDAVGIVRYPDGYAGTPRTYGRGLRFTALAVLAVFVTVVIISTGVSLGRYCLTSDGADLSTLLPWMDAK